MTRPCGRCGEPSTGLVMVPAIVCERVCNRCRADVTREALAAQVESDPRIGGLLTSMRATMRRV